MSERNLILPQSAMQQTLAFAGRDLDVLESRLRWPGAVRFAEVASVSLTQGVTSTLVSLTLEPGSWWVLGGSQIAHDSFGAQYSVALDMVGVTSAGSEVGGVSEAIVGNLETMTVVGYAILTSTTVVDLDVLWVTATPLSGVAGNSYLLAVPS